MEQTTELETQLAVLGDDYEVILKRPYAEVYRFSDSKITFLYWKKVTTFDEYKEVFEVILESHSKKPNDYFLSDIRNQGTSSPQKKEWFKETALKQAVTSGLKKGAVVMDNNPFKQFYMNVILAATNTMGLPFKTFHDINQAKAWFDG